MILAQPYCQTAIVATMPATEAQACKHCMKQFDNNLPKGTYIYTYDQLIVSDSKRSDDFLYPAKITCDAEHLYVTDPITGKISAFSVNATVTKFVDSGEVVVRPGETMPAFLENYIRLGIARFKKIL